MTASERGEFRIVDAAAGERRALEPILEDSFEGRYLWHATKTLAEIETVRIAYIGDTAVGLAMLKLVQAGAGYVYYIAVRRAYRMEGVGTKLLDDAVRHFAALGAREVYASVGEDNVESNALFSRHGFRRTDYGEVSHKYGRIHAMMMYRSMLVVPGEILLVKEQLGDASSESTAPSP